ncbi:hypothetical protein SGCZBJ_20945 [Caulobacter zeae]|uniref:DUF1579 domain-containing protein n=1 Tax=Caulobacter zeae TaxID=2055137 RepID=A0A2N5D4R7_9CAUL|nr:hypothetical protein [Caulobacter zeae]PLR21070.1 hypothetical protein SGCZBJ_20945 [Caulobacter zeae]
MRVVVSLLALSASMLCAAAARAEDPPPTPPPAQVAALAGCWKGEGMVMGKPVTVALSARPIVGGAMMLVEADSAAKADPADTYAAHLLFGGRTTKAGEPAAIVGLWADSFGGDGASHGAGKVAPNGFEVSYPYGDAAFVNRWARAGEHLSWSIVMRGAGGKEQEFASYELVRAGCP